MTAGCLRILVQQGRDFPPQSIINPESNRTSPRQNIGYCNLWIEGIVVILEQRELIRNIVLPVINTRPCRHQTQFIHRHVDTVSSTTGPDTDIQEKVNRIGHAGFTGCCKGRA